MRNFGAKKLISDNWRQTCFCLATTAFGVIAGFVLGWSAHGEAHTETRLVEILQAFGAISAAVVAVAIAVGQNYLRRKEERQRRVEREWAAAQIAKQIAEQAKNLVSGWEKGYFPHRAQFAAVHARINSLEDRVETINGVTILTELISMVSSAQAFVETAGKRPKSKKENQDRSVSISWEYDIESTMSKFREVAESLVQQASRWGDTVYSKAKHWGIEIPGVVDSGPSTATFRLRASAEGRVIKAGSSEPAATDEPTNNSGKRG